MKSHQDQTTSPYDVLIVGGGLAGLAAAVGLAEHGMQVKLLESRPRLGGRASSFVDSKTGATIDNCQHVVMGCCTNFFHFCKTIGIDHLFRTEQELYFIAKDNKVNRFASSILPAPFHLAKTFRRLTYFTKADGQLIVKGLRALMREQGSLSQQSFADWLVEHQQPQHLIDRFWQVVLVSALSESLDRIDIGHARKVFYDGFFAHRNGWEVTMPIVPLSELYGDTMQSWFQNHQIEIQQQTGVEKLILSENKICGVQLRSGEILSASQYILAVPQYTACQLLPDDLLQQETLSGIQLLETAPISSLHLWFDRQITALPHAVLVDRLGQWMFNRTIISQETKKQNGHYYQVIISASRALSQHSSDKIIQTIIAELSEIWSVTTEAKLLHSRIITEHQAVFSPLPNVDKLRPSQQSPVSNLFFAGDWTATGWPATMEGAVRSGYLAAQFALQQQSISAKLLQPDLQASWLTRVLFG